MLTRAALIVTIIACSFLAALPLVHRAIADDTKPAAATAPVTKISAVPIKALFICGGCCHDYTNLKKIITDGISARANVTWTILQEGTEREHKHSVYANPDWAKGYDVVVHDECFGYVTDDEFVNAIAKVHAAGVPAVFLHCSTHSYRMAKTDSWREMLGVSSFSHEKNRPLKVELIAKDNPIMAGFPATYDSPTDELYKVEKFWPTATALAKAYGVDTKKDHTCIWVNEYGPGKTRIFSTTLGHGEPNMTPVYLDLVTRGLLWTTGHLNEKAK